MKFLVVSIRISNKYGDFKGEGEVVLVRFYDGFWGLILVFLLLYKVVIMLIMLK